TAMNDKIMPGDKNNPEKRFQAHFLLLGTFLFTILASYVPASFLFALLIFIVIMKYIWFLEVILVVRSMTGYGVESVHIGDTQYTVEMKSVNHRFLDIKLNLPPTLNFIENKIKDYKKLFFKRGSIEVYFNLTCEYLCKNM